MRCALLAGAIVLGPALLAAQSPAQAGGADGSVISIATYALPAFDSAPADFSRELLRYADRSEYDSTRADRAFVHRHQMAHDREAQPETAVHPGRRGALGLAETIEDPRQEVRRDPSPGVADAEPRPIAHRAE